MNDLVKIAGAVEGFERTTHTSGTSNGASTTHISIFNVGSDRVLLKTVVPSTISDGDIVVLAGTRANGQFSALACNNITSGWISPLRQQGCASAALIGVAVFSFLLFFMVLPIIVGVVCLIFARKVKKHDKIMALAHQMVLNAEGVGGGAAL